MLLSICLPFRAATCCSNFCLLSDILTDLVVNDQLTCSAWDHCIVHSKYLHKRPHIVELGTTILFAQARDLKVSLLIEDQGKTYSFINDLISIAIDIDDKLDQLQAAPCYTVIHAVANSTTSSTHTKKRQSHH